jgi:hypothetical protein
MPGEMSAAQMRNHLYLLRWERWAAAARGLLAVDDYRLDLEQEINHCTHAFVLAAVAEIATLRAELSGRLHE